MEKILLLTKICRYLIIGIVAMLLQSCNDKNIVKETVSNIKIGKCYIDCSILDDQDTDTRSLHEWTEGDNLYICFNLRDIDCGGVATYKNGEWVISFDNVKPSFNDGYKKCKVTYMKGDYKTEGDFLSLTNSSVPYVSDNGMYHVAEDGSIYISATLYPSYTRFRLKGEQNATYEIKGIGFLSDSKMNIWTGAIANAKNIVNTQKVTCNVYENGEYYTPYLYGNEYLEEYIYYEFSNTRIDRHAYTNSIIKIKSGSKVYAKKLDLYEGYSYSIAAPTSINHSGWIVEDYVNKKINIKETVVEGDSETIDIGVELDTETGGVSVTGQLKISRIDTDHYASVDLIARNGSCYVINAPSHYHSSYFTTAEIFSGGYDEDYQEGKINAYAWLYEGDLIDGLKLTYTVNVEGVNSKINSGSYLYISNF